LGASKKRSDDLNLLFETAKAAGEIGLGYFKSKNKVWMKPGDSPVSQADREIDDYLRETFAKKRPDYGWLSEETEDNGQRLEKDRIVIADPIDGTRGFIDGQNEWCISVAIVENSRPVEAILHCPALERTFMASRGSGIEVLQTKGIERIRTSKPLATGSKKLISTLRELPDAAFDVLDFIPSLAYRLALVAVGELDAAFARQGASEWDIAAADLILEEAGCRLVDTKGTQIRYNQPKVQVPALIATGKEQHEKIFALAKQAGFLH